MRKLFKSLYDEKQKTGIHDNLPMLVIQQDKTLALWVQITNKIAITSTDFRKKNCRNKDNQLYNIKN